MRNLKRALSLTLASVMLLGMMVVGAGAASYPDVDENDNVEAIEVLQAVQVMRGDDKGNFNPDSPVTRAEMAVVMALLLDLDYEYYEAICPFNDVPSWARPYVGACYANKIVSGYDANTYGSNDGVTPVQAASMLMRALGYFKFDVDYADGFETATVRQGTGIGIFDGVSSSATAQMTRNQVAQMALNALQCGMVEPSDNSFSITTPDGFTVSQGRTNYVYVVSRDTVVGNAINQTQANQGNANSGLTGPILDLGEQLYQGDLRKIGVNDGFQAPATRWTYKNTEIGTYTDEADYVLEGTVKSSAMYTTVGKTVAEDYTWEVYMDGALVNRNSDTDPLFGKTDVKDNDSDDLAGTGRGTTTYIYLTQPRTVNGVPVPGKATVCIVNTYGAEVTKVNNGKITLDDKDRLLEIEADGYAVDDVLLYTKHVDGSGWKIGWIIGEAELIEAEAKTVRTDKFVTIGDKTYNYNVQFNDKNGIMLDSAYAGEDVALYLDTQGNIVYLGDAKEGTDYAFVMGVGESAQYNTAKPLYGAELMLSDGTYKNVLLDKDLTDGIIKDGGMTKAAGDEDQREKDLETVRSALVGKVFAWSVNADGAYDLSSKVGNVIRNVSADTFNEKDADGNDLWKTVGAEKISVNELIKSGKASASLNDFVTGLERLKFDDETVFILNDRNNGSTDFDVYTGYKNVPDVKLTFTSVVSAYKNANGVARVVFIQDAVIDSAKDVVFIIGDPGAKETKDGSTTYREYKAVVNGEVRNVYIKSGTDAASKIYGAAKNSVNIYAGITFDSNDYVTKLKPLSEADKMSCDGPYQGTKTVRKGVYAFDSQTKYDKTYASNDDIVIVYFGEYNNSNDVLHIENSVNNDVNDKAWIVMDDGDVVAIFIREVKGDKVEKATYAVDIEQVANATITVSDEEGNKIEDGDLVEVDTVLNVSVKPADNYNATLVVNGDEKTGTDIKVTVKGATTITAKATEIGSEPEVALNVVLDPESAAAKKGVKIAGTHLVTSAESADTNSEYKGVTAGTLVIKLTVPTGVATAAGTPKLTWTKNGMDGTKDATALSGGEVKVLVAGANTLDATLTYTLTNLAVAVSHDVVIKDETGMGLKFAAATTTLDEDTGAALSLNVTSGLPAWATKVNVTFKVEGLKDSTLAGTAGADGNVMADVGLTKVGDDDAKFTSAATLCGSAKADPEVEQVTVTIVKVEASESEMVFESDVEGYSLAEKAAAQKITSAKFTIPALTATLPEDVDSVTLTYTISNASTDDATAAALTQEVEVSAASKDTTAISGSHYTANGNGPVTIKITAVKVAKMGASSIIVADPNYKVSYTVAAQTAAWEVENGSNKSDIAVKITPSANWAEAAKIYLKIKSGADVETVFTSADAVETTGKAETTITIPAGALKNITGQSVVFELYYEESKS